MEYLLDGDYYSYDMEKGYTRHAINGPGDHGIIVKLGVPSIVNHIRMLLWDRDIRLAIHFRTKAIILAIKSTTPKKYTETNFLISDHIHTILKSQWNRKTG